MNINEFLTQVGLKVGDAQSSDLRERATVIYKKVSDAMSKRNLIKPYNVGNRTVMVASDAYRDTSLAMNAIDDSLINDLMNIAGITAENGVVPSIRQAAARELALEVHRSLISGSVGVGAISSAAADIESPCVVDNQSGFSNINDLVPSYMLDENGGTGVGVGFESFGQFSDVSTVDLVSAMTMTIMKFHSAIAARMFPTRTIADSQFSIRQIAMEIFSTSNFSEAPKTLLDIYKNPSVLTYDLKKMELLTANDSSHAYLENTDLVLFRDDIPVLDLAVNANDSRLATMDRFQLIADNGFISQVRFSIGDGTNTDVFPIDLRPGVSKFERMTTGDSMDRISYFQYGVTLDKTSKTVLNSDTLTLATLADGETVVVDISVSVRTNLRTGKTNASGNIKATVTPVAGAELSEDAETIVAAIAGKVAMKNWTPEFSWAEDSIRMSEIEARHIVKQKSYQLPAGRFFSIYSSVTQQFNVQDSIAELLNLINIGIGIRTINQVRSVFSEIVQGQQLLDQTGDPKYSLENRFPAGAIVRPTAISGEFDVADLVSVRTSDLSGDAQQGITSFLVRLTEEAAANSYIAQQLAGGMNMTYRVLTTNPVIGELLGAPHIHNHLNSEDKRSSNGTIEFKKVLPNGVTLECITTTFETMNNNILMVPVIPESTESNLNGFVNFTGGSTAMQLQQTVRSAQVNRTVAAERLITVPTNPVLISIVVKNIEKLTTVNRS